MLNKDILETIRRWVNGFKYVPRINHLKELKDGLIISYLIYSCYRQMENRTITVTDIPQEERYTLIDIFLKDNCKIQEGLDIDKFKEGDLHEISKITFIILFNGITSSISEFETASNVLNNHQNQLIQNFFDLIEKLKAPTPPRESKIYEDYLCTPRHVTATPRRHTNRPFGENNSFINTNNGDALSSPMAKVIITPTQKKSNKNETNENEEQFNHRRQLEKQIAEKNNQIDDLQCQIDEKERLFKQLEHRIDVYCRKIAELNQYKEKANEHENCVEKIQENEREIASLQEKIACGRRLREERDNLQKQYDSVALEVSRLRNDLTMSNSKERLQQKEIDRLRNIESDLQYYRTCLDKKEETILDLTAERETLIIKLKDTTRDYNQHRQEAREQLEELEAQEASKQNEINLLNANYAKLNEEYTEAKQDLKKEIECILLNEEIVKMRDLATEVNEDHAKQVVHLEEQVRCICIKMSDLKEVNNRMDNEIKSLNDQITLLKTDCQAKDNSLNELMQIKNKQDVELNELHAKYNELNGTLDEYNNKFTRLKVENQEKSQEIDKLSGLVECKSIEVVDLTNKYDQIVIEKEAQVDQIVKISRDTVLNLENEIVGKNGEIQSLMNDIQKTNYENINLKNELHVAKTSVETLQNEIELKKCNINELNNCLDKNESEIDSLNCQLDKINKRLEVVQAEKDETRHELDKLVEEFELFKSKTGDDIAQKISTIHQFRDQVATLTIEREQLEVACASQRDVLQEKIQIISELQEIKNKYEMDSKELETKYADSIKSCSELQNELNYRINQFTNELGEKGEFINELKQLLGQEKSLAEQLKVQLNDLNTNHQNTSKSLADLQKNYEVLSKGKQEEVADLNGIIDAMKDDMEKRCNDMKAILKKYEQDLQDKSNIIEQLNSQIQNISLEKLEQVSSLENVISELRNKNFSLEEQSNEYKVQLEATLKRFDDLQSILDEQKKSSDEDFKQVQSQIDAKNIHINELKQEINCLNEKCVRLNQELTTMQTNFLSEQTNVEIKNGEIIELQSIKLKYERDITDLSEKNDKLKQAYDQLEKILNNLKVKYKELVKERDDEVRKFHETMNNLDSNLDNTRKLNEELLTKHKDQLRDLNEQRQRELNQFDSDTQTRERKIQDLESRLYAESQEKSHLANKFDTEVRNLQATIGEHSRLNDSLKQDLLVKDDNFKKLQANFDVLMMQKNDESVHFSNELNRLNSRLKEAQQQRDLAESRLNEIKVASVDDKTLIAKYQHHIDSKINEYNALVIQNSALNSKIVNLDLAISQKTSECELLTKRCVDLEHKAQLSNENCIRSSDFEKVKNDLTESKQLISSYERHFKDKEIELVKLHKELEMYREQSTIKMEKLEEESVVMRQSLIEKDEEIKRLTVAYQKMDDHIKKFELHYQNKKNKFQQVDIELQQKVVELSEKNEMLRAKEDELNRLRSIETEYETKLTLVSKENTQLKTSADYLERRLREIEKRESVDYNYKINPTFNAYNNQSQMKHPLSNPNFASSTILKTPQPKHFNDDSLVKYSSPDLKTNDLLIQNQDVDTRRVSIDTISSFRTNANSTLSTTQNQNAAFNNRFEAISESDFEAALNSNKYLPFEADNTRLSMLQARNQKQKPHLKSSYALEVDLGLANNAASNVNALKNRETPRPLFQSNNCLKKDSK